MYRPFDISVNKGEENIQGGEKYEKGGEQTKGEQTTKREKIEYIR